MLEEMRKMIAEQLNCEESEITADTSFKDDLGADSLDLFELVMALEDEYNIEIPAEELTELATVGDVIEYIKRQRHRSLVCRTFPEAVMSQGFSEFIYFERQERYNDKDQNKICTEPYRKNACR